MRQRSGGGWRSPIAAFLWAARPCSPGSVGLVITEANIDDSTVSGTHPPGSEATAGAAVGQCLQGRPGAGSVVTDRAVVPCGEQHGAEVLAVIEAPGGANRPSEAALSDYAAGARRRWRSAPTWRPRPTTPDRLVGRGPLS